jgi:hypothetical protein
MTPEQHKARHRRLHQYLDELVADWITHTGGLPCNATILDLMAWSSSQCQRPTPGAEEEDDKRGSAHV